MDSAENASDPPEGESLGKKPPCDRSGRCFLARVRDFFRGGAFDFGQSPINMFIAHDNSAVLQSSFFSKKAVSFLFFSGSALLEKL